MKRHGRNKSILAAALLVCLLAQSCLSRTESSSEETAENELDPLEEYKDDTDLNSLDDSREAELAAIVQSIQEEVESSKLSVERRSKPKCPDTFVQLYHAGQIAGCFRVVTTRTTWEESPRICSAYDERARLAVLNTQLKTNAVKAKLRGLTNAHIRDCNRIAAGSESFWIATARDTSSGCRSPYYWYPNYTPLTHGDWGAGEPNCLDGGVSGASCVALTRGLNYQWNDVHCSRKICSICEIPI